MTATELRPAVHPGSVHPGSVRTVPNLITAARTVVAVAVGVAALVAGSVVLLLVAYGCYWVGDALDGWTARRLHQETRVGAVSTSSATARAPPCCA